MGFLRRYRNEIKAEVESMRDPRAARGCLGALAAQQGAVALEAVTIAPDSAATARSEIVNSQAHAVIDTINRRLQEDYPDCSGRIYLEVGGQVLLRCGAQDCLLPRAD